MRTKALNEQVRERQLMIKDYLNKTLDEINGSDTRNRRPSEESKQTGFHDYSSITLNSKEYDQRYKLSPQLEAPESKD